MKSLVPWVCLVATTTMQGALANDGIDAYRKGQYFEAAEKLPALSGKDPIADYYLGQIRLYGYGQLKNNTLALRHFKLAGEKGFLPAQQIMARYSLLAENNPENALYWFKKAAEANDTSAQMYCAAAYLYGLGVKKNPDLAKRYYTAAAKNGNSVAQYTLADDFLSSKHSQNKKLGLIWLNKAIAQGHLQAKVKLAELYAQGNAVPKDINKAKGLLQETLNQDYPPAFFAMGEITMVENNLPETKKWLTKAAEKNYIPAQIALSQLHYQTNSPLFDPRLGYLWLLRAAQNRSTDAQLMLANLYKEGRFVARDADLVKEWEEEARESNKDTIGAQTKAAEWLSNGKEKTLAKSGYKLQGIFSDWQNPNALKENTYNQPPQMQEVNRQALYKPQFSMVLPNEIPINEYYNALSSSLGEIKNSYAHPNYPIDFNYAISLSDVGLSPYISVGENEFHFSFEPTFDAFALMTPQTQEKSKKKSSVIKELYDQAILGDPGAQFTLGQRYQQGVGVEKDIGKALHFYQLAAAQNDTQSIYTLGLLFLEGKEVPKDDSEAIRWLSDAAFKGNAYAQFVLAGLYEKGIKGEKGKDLLKSDLQQAISLYFLSSFNNYGPSQYRLAELLVRDDKNKLTLNEKQARQLLIKSLYEKAVMQGVPEANLPLAFFNAMDKDSAKQAQAFAVAQKEALNGNGQAALLLGLLYDRGLGNVEKNQTEALAWYEKAPKNSITSFILGTYYSEGKITTRDIERGRVLLQQAADQGFSFANLNLAILKHDAQEPFLPELDTALALGNSKAGQLLADYYLSNASDEHQMKQSREIYKLFAEKGDKESQLKLAFMLENSLGGDEDILGAQMWYTQAAEQNQPMAAFLLGRLYQLGKLDKQPNYEEAKKWYNIAKSSYPPAAIALGFIFETVENDYQHAFSNYDYAAKNNSIGAFDLGLMYEKGKGRAVDYQLAKDWYEKASIGNHPKAMVQLAGIYFNGSAEVRDEQKGIELYKKAAALGDKDALYQLGLLHETGVGTSLNLKDALNYYQQAANKGNAKAILALARMYQFGLGVEKDNQKAESLYKEAANLNIPYAQYQLATFYFESGDGTPMLAQAKRLLQQAQENGSIQAGNILQLINAQTELKTSYIEPLPMQQTHEIAKLPADLLYLDAINEWNRGDEASTRKILDRIITEYPHYTPAKRTYEQLHQSPGIVSFKKYTQLNA